MARPLRLHSAASGAPGAQKLFVWALACVLYWKVHFGTYTSSADAAGYPISPLLVTPDEVKNNNVDHAIRYAIAPPNNSHASLSGVITTTIFLTCVLRFILPNDRIRLNTWLRPSTHSGPPLAEP